MVDCSTEDLVLLHLGYSDSDRYSKTVPGISEGIGVDKSETARGFRLFSALSDLKENGVIEEKVEYIEDVDDERNTYHLTPKGEERYRELRNEFEKEEIRVKNGTTKEIKLKEVDEHLDFDENALVKTLAEVNSDGVLYLEKDFDDFVGRENELENLNRILDEVRDGNTRAVLVSGPAGIGKTTMIEKAVEEADDFRFLRAKSHQDVSSPYQPVIDALSDIGKDLERILEDHTKPETQDEEVYSTQRKAIFNEFTQHIKETSSQSPLVLFLDDLQWSDNATLDLFSHVIERIDDEPVLFAGTYRIEELDESDKLHEVIDSSDHEIRLDPLGFEETETIVQ